MEGNNPTCLGVLVCLHMWLKVDFSEICFYSESNWFDSCFVLFCFLSDQFWGLEETVENGVLWC